ncbi:MAG TPA: S46 family peptidase [Planctomycetota bacterium]|jgi:hypothetical protein|nr:S46 family peptidase [Planctomycetota bacterium]
MRLLSLAFALLISALPAQGVNTFPAQMQLGMGKMWTFENLPKEYLKSTYGLDVTQEWLDKTRMASLRFGGGCSASFVSPNGLIMTNHHCVRDFVAKASPSDADWVQDGFVATDMGMEARLPGCEVEQLISMRDVTSIMNEGINEDDDAATVASRRRDNRRQLESQARTENPGLKIQIVSLYQGAQQMLYVYKVWEDVRIVVSPHLQTAHFGGDPDNFTYPRYSIDFAFCRAYENDKPVDSSQWYFKWTSEGVKEGDLVFVTGNPGSTGRLKTYAQLEYERDFNYPQTLDFINQQVDAMLKASKESPEKEKEIRPELLQMQNAQKNYRGTLDGLNNASLMTQKREGEKAFRAALASRTDLAQKYLNAWDNLEALVLKQQKAAIYQPAGLDHLLAGVMINRILDPSAPSGTKNRLRTNLSRLQEVGIDDSDVAKQREFASRLEKAEAAVGKDDLYLTAMRRAGSYEATVAQIARESKLGDAAFVQALLDGGAEALEKSEDPALLAGRVLLPLLIANQSNTQQLQSAMAVEEAKIGRAYYEVYGNTVSPDATFTLRLSDGVVKGYPCNGTIAPATTTFWGLYGRNVEFGNQYPFNVADVWIQRRSRIDLNARVNFVSTNDIIGGNSGSPVINAKQEIVGLVFDGNIESLPNNYVFRDDKPRAVSVHTDAIMESLTKIYDADRVAKELLGK